MVMICGLDNISMFYSFLILVVCVTVSVASLTFLEREVMGYIQICKGPNKVMFMGIRQPFSAAIKLFNKEQTYPLMSNFYLYYLAPVCNLFLSLSIWLCTTFFS